MARTPGTTAVLVISIALGLGSNAIVASFVRGLVSTDLQIEAPERAVAIFARSIDGAYGPANLETYSALKGGTDLFELLGAAAESRVGITARDRSLVASLALLTPDAAALLGLNLDAGMAISPRLWRDAFDGKPLEGEAITVDGSPHAVTSVAPEWLHGIFTDSPVDVWILASEDELSSRAATWWLLARLKAADVSTAQQQVNSTRSGDRSLAVLPYAGLRPEAAGAQRRIGTLLTTAAGFVLLIACVNVAIFLLARGMVRARETAVRVAIGVTRRQLAAGLLSDAIVLGVLGGAAGILFALWTSDILPAMLFDSDASDLRFVADRRWLMTAGGLCLGALVLCGLSPLLEVRHDDPAAVLKRDISGPSPRGRFIRMALVSGQMTICCILLVAAALLILRFDGALRTPVAQRLGPAALVTAEAAAAFSGPNRGRRYFADVERAAFSVPEVHEIAWTGTPPGGRSPSLAVRVETAPPMFTPVTLETAVFTPQSLAEIDPVPVAGRIFGGADTPDACRVAVINEPAATRIFDGDALGRVLQDPLGGVIEVVGVVAMRPRKDGRHRQPLIYYYAPQLQNPDRVPARQVFGAALAARSSRQIIDEQVVTTNYLRLIEADVVEGSSLQDVPEDGACRSGVVNVDAAQRLFGGKAVGGALIDTSGRRTTITGIVSGSTLGVNQRAGGPVLYVSPTQQYVPRMTLLTRMRAENQDVITRLEKAVKAVEGARMPPVVTTLDAHLARTALSTERIAATLVGASAVIGCLLGLFGLYGALSDAGRQRRREFAVRSALGARGWHIAGEVLRDGLQVAAIGTLLGLLGSVLVDRWVTAVLPYSTARPLLAWIAPPLVLFLSVLVASALPARRAIAVSPLSLMKEE